MGRIVTLLEIHELTKRFAGLAAVRDFTMEVNQGEIVGLIGPNGAGKTTVFNLITGFLPPTNGGIVFRESSIVGRKPFEICKLGIGRTFQLARPFQGITVLENVLIGAFNRHKDVHEARKETDKILEMVGLYSKKDFLAKELTAEDQKRLELAKALATKPELLLLDEVMGGLNETEILSVIELLRQLGEMGMTLLVIEHVMSAIMALCHRNIVIHHGEKIAQGTPNEIANDEGVIKAYLGRGYRLASS